MGPVERVAARGSWWLFTFSLALFAVGFGLVMLVLGLVLGVDGAVFAGLVVLAPACAGCVAVMLAAQKRRSWPR